MKKKRIREREQTEEVGKKPGKEKNTFLCLTLTSLTSLACVASSSESGARCRREASQASASKMPSSSRSWFVVEVEFGERDEPRAVEA